VLGATAISSAGDYFAAVGIAFGVLAVGGSAGALGLVLAARLTALVACLLAGGVIGDRVPRQLLGVGMNLLRSASQGMTAVLLLTGQATLWQLAVLQAAHGIGSALYLPAATALVPQVVSDPADLQKANALLSGVQSTAAVIGPLVAGILVTAVGPGWALAADSASFLVAAALLVRVRASNAPPTQRQSFWAELAAGWRTVVSTRWLCVSLVQFGLIQLVVLGPLYVLGPWVAQQALGGADVWGLILTAFGVGNLVGSLVAFRTRPRRPLQALFAVSMLFAPSLFLLAGAAQPAAVAVAMLLGGMAMTFANTVWRATLQERIEGSMLARVSAYDWLGSMALRPVGLALAGPLAVGLGPAPTLVTCALVLLVSSAICCTLPSIRATVENRPMALTAVTPSS
jgi:MFS family permease